MIRIRPRYCAPSRFSSRYPMKTGQVVGQLRQSTREFRRSLDTVEANVPTQMDVYHPRQLRQSYDRCDSTVVAQATALPCALQVDRRLLAQSRGTRVRAADGEAIAAWGGASQHAGVRRSHPGVHGLHQCAAQAPCVDENHRSDFGGRRSILSSDVRLRTLAHFSFSHSVPNKRSTVIELPCPAGVSQ